MSATLASIRVPEADLDRVASQLTHARLPAESVVKGAEASWEYGTSLDKLKNLVAAWRDGGAEGLNGKVLGKGAGQGFKSWWRSVEERLNAYPNYDVEIEGVRLHFVHARSAHEDAIPLIFCHGWPGSFYEAYPLIPKLLEKDENGIAFHIIAPCLPGYGWSNAGGLPDGWSGKDNGRIFVKLVTEVLGYDRFMAQGGDWGSLMTRFIANDPKCLIYHTNFMPPTKPPLYAVPVVLSRMMGFTGLFDLALRGMSPFDAMGLKRGVAYETTGGAYAQINGQKPSTIGFALYDNPVGILSYMYEKFELWCDPRCQAFGQAGDKPVTEMTEETILINASIYALTDTVATSKMLYRTDLKNWRHGLEQFAAAQSKPFGRESFFV